MKFLIICVLTLSSSMLGAQGIPDSMGSAGATLNQTKNDPAAKQAARETNELKDQVEDLVDETDLPSRKSIEARREKRIRPKK